MPKYLVEATYTDQGSEGVLAAGGSARRQVAAETCSAVGGKLESFYFAFGDRDAIIIAELPDNAAAAAIALAVNASGGIRTKTTVLLTPEEIDEAAQEHVKFRPPGH